MAKTTSAAVAAAVAANNAAVNERDAQVINAVILGANYGTKKRFVREPDEDGNIRLVKEIEQTVVLSLDRRMFRTDGGTRTNMYPIELSQFKNRLVSAKNLDTRKLARLLKGKDEEELDCLFDLPVEITVFRDVMEDGKEVERILFDF